MPLRQTAFFASRFLAAIALVAAFVIASPAQAAHAYAQFGDIKYPAGFDHFDWVNPNAPKGGSFSLVAPIRISNYDKYNPFTLKGNAPPGIGAMFDSLLASTMDEPTTAYGLLAEDVEVPPDKMSVTFRLNPKARFSNGKPVLAEDVKYTFDTLVGPKAAPQYRMMLADVKRSVVLGDRLIRFEFSRASAELPLLIGSLAVFSRDWGAGKDFDKVVMDMPIASGPYKISRVDFGRDVTYQRRPDYWAQDLNVRRGQNNFDFITYHIYNDGVAQFEAFKAGEFDYQQAFIARDWARQYKGGKFETGEIIKRAIPNGNAGDFQGFLINTRRPQFADPRVRQALILAMDFEWMNRQLFYGAYARVRGYFTNSDFEAKGMPGPDELKVLEPLRGRLKPEVFTQPVPMPPTTDPPNSLRGNLRQAKELLAESGWTYHDGALRNAKGEPFTIEFLDSEGGMTRVVAPYVQALAKLGIQTSYRGVDFALLQKRLDVYDFDMTSIRLVGSEAPGSELFDRFTSQAAKTEGSSNLSGISDPAVDELVKEAVNAKTRPELVARLRALDRVLRWGFYFVPHWYQSSFRIAYYANRFGQPAVMPRYFQPENWIVSTWWALPAKGK